MKHLQNQRRRSRQRAFSLVEVVFALGLTAGTMTVLVGLIPVSLTAFANAKKDTIRANILQDVSATANQTPYSDITNTAVFMTNQWYYDDQGQQVGNGGTPPATALYKAWIPQLVFYPLPPYTATTTDRNMCVLEVEIDKVSGSANALANSSTTNSLIIANQGK